MAGIKVPLSIKDIYQLLCPKCKVKLDAMAKEKIAEALAKNILEGSRGEKKPK